MSLCVSDVISLVLLLSPRVLFGPAVVCSALSAQGSDATHSSGLAGVTGGPASGEGALVTLLSDDDQLDEDPSGGGSENFRLHGKTPLT